MLQDRKRNLTSTVATRLRTFQKWFDGGLAEHNVATPKQRNESPFPFNTPETMSMFGLLHKFESGLEGVTKSVTGRTAD